VSVIIPVFNGAKYLGAAIGSVRAQERGADELIVVDDGSTDESAAIAAAAGATVIRQENAGAGVARNTGIEAATGDVIAFLDADDLWLPSKTALQTAELGRDAGVGIVVGQVVQFRGEPPSTFDGLERLTGYVPGAVLVRRKVFERIGPFDPQYRIGEFIDWWGRAMDASVGVSTLDDVVMLRRLHDANTGLQQAERRTDYAKLARAALARRRAAGTAE